MSDEAAGEDQGAIAAQAPLREGAPRAEHEPVLIALGRLLSPSYCCEAPEGEASIVDEMQGVVRDVLPRLKEHHATLLGAVELRERRIAALRSERDALARVLRDASSAGVRSEMIVAEVLNAVVAALGDHVKDWQNPAPATSGTYLATLAAHGAVPRPAPAASPRETRNVVDAPKPLDHADLGNDESASAGASSTRGCKRWEIMQVRCVLPDGHLGTCDLRVPRETPVVTCWKCGADVIALTDEPNACWGAECTSCGAAWRIRKPSPAPSGGSATGNEGGGR